MIDGELVIDGVAHYYNVGAQNHNPRSRDIAAAMGGMLYQGLHCGFSPRGQPKWVMSQAQWLRPDAEVLAHALFAESQTDIAIYHEVPLWGLFKDGGSPIWVGRKMQELYPGRVALYGAVTPLHDNWKDTIDRLVGEYQVAGVKFYPADIVDGKASAFRFDDPKLMFPVLSYLEKVGIRNVGVHKAMPMGPVPLDPFKVTDVDMAAVEFPTMSFEIVHGGFAFVEETAMQLSRFPNVSVNLEGTTGYLINQPRRFAELLGAMLMSGAEDRITWATGCIAVHPRPFIEAFWNLEMPQDLVDGYGFPQLTVDIKRKILGLNQARICGFDIPAMQAKAAGDRFSKLTDMAEPWSAKEVVA